MIESPTHHEHIFSNWTFDAQGETSFDKPAYWDYKNTLDELDPEIKERGYYLSKEDEEFYFPSEQSKEESDQQCAAGYTAQADHATYSGDYTATGDYDYIPGAYDYTTEGYESGYYGGYAYELSTEEGIEVQPQIVPDVSTVSASPAGDGHGGGDDSTGYYAYDAESHGAQSQVSNYEGEQQLDQGYVYEYSHDENYQPSYYYGFTKHESTAVANEVDRNDETTNQWGYGNNVDYEIYETGNGDASYGTYPHSERSAEWQQWSIGRSPFQWAGQNTKVKIWFVISQLDYMYKFISSSLNCLEISHCVE